MLPPALAETPILQQEQCLECSLRDLVVKFLVMKALYLEIRVCGLKGLRCGHADVPTWAKFATNFAVYALKFQPGVQPFNLCKSDRTCLL
jgi:hypothetical protein